VENGDINNYLKLNPLANRILLVSLFISLHIKYTYTLNLVMQALDVAAGISYLHANNIIHGDLKGVSINFSSTPSTTYASFGKPNILVDDSGRARVADFGLSAVTDPMILQWTSLPFAASIGGSRRWQAPELFSVEDEEEVPNSEASDVYAWACVCYEVGPSHACLAGALFLKRACSDIYRQSSFI
jgi:serine/threonine protein kinase